MRMSLHGPRRDAERRRDLRFGQVEVVAQDQAFSLAIGQRPQGCDHPLAVVAGLQRRLRRRPDSRRPGPETLHDLAVPESGPSPVEDCAAQVGEGLGRIAEPRPRQVGLHERVLDDLLGVGWVVQEERRQPDK